jgi:hypothetical protein
MENNDYKVLVVEVKGAKKKVMHMVLSSKPVFGFAQSL